MLSQCLLTEFDPGEYFPLSLTLLTHTHIHIHAGDHQYFKENKEYDIPYCVYKLNNKENNQM